MKTTSYENVSEVRPMNPEPYRRLRPHGPRGFPRQDGAWRNHSLPRSHPSDRSDPSDPSYPSHSPRTVPRLASAALTLVATALLLTGCAHGRRALPESAYLPNIWPTAANARTVTSPFGARGSDTHAGVDIAARKKSPVCATAYGRVTYTGRDRGGYGKHVIIDHGRYETLYAHLSRIKTKPGKTVRRGQVIGRVGKTGNASAPHVHYEIRQNGTPIDPTPFLP
jgi:murein DD-endopeptidase MepM/ murein hydrolase activator NlpD